MGCDYYIVTELHIEHDGGYESIELDRQRCWWCDFPYDIDDPDQPDPDEYYYERYLKTDKKPIFLFDNGKWQNETLRDKYEPMVSTMIDGHKLIKAFKIEYRYARV
jgi:hypothetical protein